MGILDWLDSFFTHSASYIGKQVSDVVHWALRGVTSVVFGTFGAVARAWTTAYADTVWFAAQVKRFTAAAEHTAAYILTVRIPALARWAAAGFIRAAAAARALAAALARGVTALAARITATASAITRWVIRSVFAPLQAFARKTYADLLKWGYGAYWWITHPQALADALILHLAASLEKNAWQLAGILGRFTLALVARNARRLALLTESIVTAVL